MAYPHPHFPSLTQSQLDGARLFADREAMLNEFARTIPSIRGGKVAEVGVALGDFSEKLIDKLDPLEFVAFDAFEMHKTPTHWGVSSEVLFGGKTHRQFFESRFRNSRTKVVCCEGYSDATIPEYPDGYFDLIYVDASHTYEGVSVDAVNAFQKLAANKVMIFNDYIMYDHMLGAPYGVVQAVNELITREGLHVIGFSLQQHMFCDIAVSALPLEQLVR